jgi:hypothetical protein
MWSQRVYMDGSKIYNLLAMWPWGVVEAVFTLISASIKLGIKVVRYCEDSVDLHTYEKKNVLHKNYVYIIWKVCSIKSICTIKSYIMLLTHYF